MTSISLSLPEFIVFLLGGTSILLGMLALAEIGSALKRIARALELSNSLRVRDKTARDEKKGESS